MKTLLKIIAVLVLGLVVVVGAALLWLDPNVFKPRIEQLARQQGVALRIEGDLGWRFWPALGIEINDVSVAATAEPEAPLAQLDSASLLVQTAPLWRGELTVEHLVVSGAEVILKVDEQGRGNWEAFKTEPPPTAPDSAAAAQETGPAKSLELAVKRLSLNHIKVSYFDARNGRKLDAQLQALGVTDFNLDDRPFELTSEWRLALSQAGAPDQSLALEGRLEARARLDKALTHLRLSEGSVALSVSGPSAAERLSGEFALALNQLGSAPVYSGKFDLDAFNLKKLMAGLGLAVPETADPEALTVLGMSGEFRGSADSVALAPLSLTLDDTSLNGEIRVTDLTNKLLEVTLAADAINADHYLPPESDSPPASEGEDSSEPLIPLESVRALNARVNLDLGELKIAGLTARDLRLRLKARDGLVQLTEASLNAYEGRAQARATLDGRGDTARIDFDSEVAGVRLAPVLKDLALEETLQLTGAINLNASGRTRGVMAGELFDALAVDAQFSGAEVTVAPINVEAYFCKAVALTRQSSSQKSDAGPSWPAYTDLRELTGRLRLRDRVVTVMDFSAGVGQLILGARGQVDLGRERFDLRLPLTLQGNRTSDNGCSVQSNYWVNRSLSLLGCSGRFESFAPAKDCGLVPKALQSLAGDYTKYRLQRELRQQLAPDEADEDGERDATKEAVRGLLNQFLDSE